jgi:fatty acid desaturase
MKPATFSERPGGRARWSARAAAAFALVAMVAMVTAASASGATPSPVVPAPVPVPKTPEQPGLFDTFMGLPIHILVSHFTVVLVPFSAMAVIAVSLRKAWREKYAGPLAAMNVAMLALTFVTVRAGLNLKLRYRASGDTETPKFNHETLGQTLLWIMVALAVVSLLTWAVGRMGTVPPAAAIALAGVVALLATSSIVFVTLAGHTGAKTQWEEFIQGSDKQLNKKH